MYNDGREQRRAMLKWAVALGGGVLMFAAGLGLGGRGGADPIGELETQVRSGQLAIERSVAAHREAARRAGAAEEALSRAEERGRSIASIADEIQGRVDANTDSAERLRAIIGGLGRILEAIHGDVGAIAQ